MKLLISGYRNYHNRKVIEHEMLEILKHCPEPHTIIHGDCSGVDKLAESIALQHGWNVEVYPYLKELGKAGGPIRNQQMITDGKPDYVLLFLSPESKGTKHMLGLVEKHNLNHTLIKLM